MRRRSLRARVTLVSVGLLVVAIVGLGGAANVLLARALTRDAKVVLQARADAVSSTVDASGSLITVRDGSLDAALDEQAWVFAGGRMVAGPGPSSSTTKAAFALAGARQPTERLALAGTVRLLAVPSYESGTRHQIATVVVGLSTVPYTKTEHRAVVGTSIFGLLLLLVGAAVAWRAVGAALTPVARMAHDAEEWSEHDLDRRFALGPANDELSRLASTLDGMLGRIAASRRHEQRFSAEMAHEIRTPLAALRGEAELLRRRSADPQAVSIGVDAVLGHADRMADVVDVLMRVARDEMDPSAGTGDGLGAARRVVGATEAAAAARGVQLRAHGADGLPAVGAPGDLIERALQPLVDNAVRYARSAVQVGVSEHGGEVWFAVDDDGPGVPTALAETLLEPGVRGEDSSGVGLGLALSSRLAASCHGQVELEAAGSPQGGARLVLRLPALS